MTLVVAASLTITITVLTVACGVTSRPALPTTPEEDCGDMVDPTDACPLLDGCPNSHTSPSTDTDDDGCPGHGGIPFAAACNSDGGRFMEIAAALRQKPKLTTLRITSSVTGCADGLRSGLERAGIAHDRLETFTRPTHSATPCDRWGYFSVVAWDGGRCQSTGS
jgi:hypothetical protein